MPLPPRHVPVLLLLLVGCTSSSGPRQPTESTTAKPTAASSSRRAALWAQTQGQPSVARSEPLALSLHDGGVLVIGGTLATGSATSVVERYDTTSDSFSAAAPLNQPRQLMTGAVRLDGAALVLGGTGAAQTSAELYSSNSWELTAALNVARTRASAVALTDGTVLVVGPTVAAEVFQLDGGFTGANPMAQGHPLGTATLLADGTVLVLGGIGASVAERYQPATDVWANTSGPARSQHTTTLLTSGQVLVVGGLVSSSDGGPAALRFDPDTQAIVPVPGLPSGFRRGHSATALPGGDVIIAGGDGTMAFGAQRYVSALDRFVNAGCLHQPRTSHAAAALPSGTVLLVGGIAPDGGTLASAERLDLNSGLLAQGQSCGADCECASGFCVDGVCCDAACQGGCQACAAASGATADGTCTTLPAATVCRAADGGCDTEEQCNGLSAECPADAVKDAGTVCRAGVGTCDRPETCDGQSKLCPADQLLASGTVCRAADAGCDVSEVCSGASPACPPDGFVDAGIVCRASDGGCDLAEVCSGSTRACPGDSVAQPGTVCRAAAGPCDLAEVCTGSRGCPADVLRDAGVVCLAANGLCDQNDLCTGSSPACPPTFVAAGSQCRAAAGPCDLPETCSGQGPACPTDFMVPMGTLCRGAAGTCDRIETCTGSSPLCPANQLQPAGFECRPAVSVCDVPETCDGVSAQCDADRVVDAGVVCRPSRGECDFAETCGGGPFCPDDGHRENGFICRRSTGACDSAEVCDGTADSCPQDVRAMAGTPCRAALGDCDVAETCDGTAVDCPADQRAGADVVCRAAVDTCDLAETCIGEINCPVDAYAEAGAACPNGACTGAGPQCPPACLADSDCAKGYRCTNQQCVIIPKRYSGWACNCGAASAETAWLSLLPLALAWLHRRSRPSPRQRAGDGTRHPARAVRLGCWLSLAGSLALLTPQPASAAELVVQPPIKSEFAVRLSGIFLRDFLASAIGGEVGAAVTLGRRFDLDGALSLGSNVGGRLGVSWHMRDDDERFRPFVQLRGVLHRVPEGYGYGGGALGGVFVRFGPGRVVGGLLVEGYAGPPGYPHLGLFASVGYQLDVYRSIEREGLKLSPLPLEPLPPPQLGPAATSTTDAGTTAASSATSSASATASSRLSLNEVLTFGERRAVITPAHEPALKRLAALILKSPHLKTVEVGGHADDGDDANECARLSERRANATVTALVKLGVSRLTLLARGYGNTRPLMPMQGPARKRELNRRVDFIVLEYNDSP